QSQFELLRDFAVSIYVDPKMIKQIVNNYDIEDSKRYKKDAKSIMKAKASRDALYTFLTGFMGLPKIKIAEVLGISKTAVTLQFPRRVKNG
ncbi:MAG: hypothetical protein ACREQ5_26895, partial [Candidatus Dormibacteria bacterium]